MHIHYINFSWGRLFVYLQNTGSIVDADLLQLAKDIRSFEQKETVNFKMERQASWQEHDKLVQVGERALTGMGDFYSGGPVYESYHHDAFDDIEAIDEDDLEAEFASL